jgi:hypothetical protein
MGLPVGAQAPFTDGFTRRKSAPIPAFLRQLAEKENIITDGFTRRSTILFQSRDAIARQH